MESLTDFSPQLPVGYQSLSSNPLPIDKEINLDSSLVQVPLPEPSYAKPGPDQSLVSETINLGSPPIYHSVFEEHHAHVLLVSSDSPESKNDSHVSANT